MAKKLLYVFVLFNIINFIIGFLSYGERSIETFIGIWIGISVIAICESIEKTQNIN